MPLRFLPPYRFSHGECVIPTFRAPKIPLEQLKAIIETSLDEDKAEDIVSISLKGKSDMADYMIIASGRSARHVASLADKVADKLNEAGMGFVPIEGKQTGDWVLLDAGDIIVHLFRPEIRQIYHLERMWTMDVAAEARAIATA